MPCRQRRNRSITKVTNIWRKKYDEAVGEFQKALRVAPSAIDPLNGLVQAYLGKGRADLALPRIKSQLRITSPTLHQAYYLLGQFHERQKHSTDAVRAYQHALDLQPKWDAPYFALAQHYQAKGDTKQAQAVLEAAQRAVPLSQTLSLYLASMFEANKSYDRAIVEYEKLLKANPGLDIAANNLASLLIDRRGDKASIERSMALTRRFQNFAQPAYLDTLGWAMIKSGQARRGLAYVEKALAAEGEVAAYHFHAGVAYQTLGNKDKAKAHLLKALATGSKFSGHEQAKALVAGL
jgi:tetratricopeptide (TPR) repeat protein